MSYSHRRITLQQGMPGRKPKVHGLLLFAVCALIPLAYLLVQLILNPSRGLLDDQLRQVEYAIRENMDALEKLEYHERRLSAAAGNSLSYRIPVLVQGRSIYVTVDASGLEELASSLALEDLLIRHHRKLKGDFRSADVAEWHCALVGISREAEGILMTTDLPGLRNRMDEIRRATAELEVRRMSLQGKIAQVTH